MILIDLQKALNTIDHEILLQKLKVMKFSGSTIKWFKSYLSDSIFLVNIENKLSDFGSIFFRVRQGVSATLLLYPDNSYILCQRKDVAQIENDSMKTLKIFVTGLLITN